MYKKNTFPNTAKFHLSKSLTNFTIKGKYFSGGAKGQGEDIGYH